MTDIFDQSTINLCQKKQQTFLQNQRIRLDDADWYKDLAIIRNKVAFDSFFKCAVREVLPFLV